MEQKVNLSDGYIPDEKDVLEANITRKIKADLEKRENVWFYKTHGHVMARAGVPDIVCCVCGFFVAIEIKRISGKLTKLQEECINEINNKGGNAIVVYGFNDYMEKFNKLYEEHTLIKTI